MAKTQVVIYLFQAVLKGKQRALYKYKPHLQIHLKQIKLLQK